MLGPDALLQRAMHTTSDFPLILDGAMGHQVARIIGQREPAM